ncbi:hypothetical protein RND81_06G097200 [Saponaria officinalis]|uniref:Uncharacterized protein n=1 Tax=Saponaria officinalis TaxID=3572 RepID=A0AAW1K9U2_SAPOF
MDFDEFQESDFIFSDYSSDQSVDSNDEDDINQNRQHYYNPSSNGSRMTMLKKKKSIPMAQTRINSSAPINIPIENKSFRYDVNVECSEPLDEDYFVDNEDQCMRLPPHVIIERRVNEEMARSFSPLKGRNMCEVRNSILRMTGFLER